MLFPTASRSLLATTVRSRIAQLSALSPSSAPQVRAFASVLPNTPETSITQSTTSNQKGPEDGRLRPNLNIPVNPNHGLYAFFRKKEKDGQVTYETIETMDPIQDKSGRAWSAAELRRKSFKDLHTLWYVLLRERNLLATQAAEARRLGIDSVRTPVNKSHRVRKSMARIKYVINERRLAYEGAVAIHEERRQMLLDEKGARKEAHEAAAAAKAQDAANAVARAEDKARRQENTAETNAANLAAGGLFDTVGVSQGAGSSASKQV